MNALRQKRGALFKKQLDTLVKKIQNVRVSGIVTITAIAMATMDAGLAKAHALSKKRENVEMIQIVRVEGHAQRPAGAKVTRIASGPCNAFEHEDLCGRHFEVV
jgi:hypothetical protein